MVAALAIRQVGVDAFVSFDEDPFVLPGSLCVVAWRRNFARPPRFRRPSMWSLAFSDASDLPGRAPGDVANQAVICCDRSPSLVHGFCNAVGRRRSGACHRRTCDGALRPTRCGTHDRHCNVHLRRIDDRYRVIPICWHNCKDPLTWLLACMSVGSPTTRLRAQSSILRRSLQSNCSGQLLIALSFIPDAVGGQWTGLDRPYEG